MLRTGVKPDLEGPSLGFQSTGNKQILWNVTGETIILQETTTKVTLITVLNDSIENGAMMVKHKPSKKWLLLQNMSLATLSKKKYKRLQFHIFLSQDNGKDVVHIRDDKLREETQLWKQKFEDNGKSASGCSQDSSCAHRN